MKAKTAIRLAECPACGQMKGSPCRDRKSRNHGTCFPHAERFDLARFVLDDLRRDHLEDLAEERRA